MKNSIIRTVIYTYIIRTDFVVERYIYIYNKPNRRRVRKEAVREIPLR